MLSYEEIKKIARYLMDREGWREIAIGQGRARSATEDEVFYCSVPDDLPINAPFSCTVNMIQVLNTHGYQGYGVLQSHPFIYTTEKTGVMEKEMAKMNNIKLQSLDRKRPEPSYKPPIRCHKVPSDGRFLPCSEFRLAELAPVNAAHMGGASKIDDFNRVYMMAAFALVTGRFVINPNHADANIGALLTQPNGQIIAWALNRKEFNSTYHAEVNLLQSLFFNNPKRLEGLPKDCRLYTTLKPCNMCAGMIKHVGGGTINVIYGQNDSSADARSTCLDHSSNKGKQWMLGRKSKPIIIDVGHGPTPVSQALHQHREATKRHGLKSNKMWESLHQPGALDIMRASTLQKLGPILEAGGMIGIVKHVAEFLHLRGVSPKQILTALDEHLSP